MQFCGVVHLLQFIQSMTCKSCLIEHSFCFKKIYQHHYNPWDPVKEAIVCLLYASLPRHATKKEDTNYFFHVDTHPKISKVHTMFLAIFSSRITDHPTEYEL